jgi:flagellar hook protein FlgE
MTISGLMFTASTALDAFGNSISVAGANIANVNTAGFKASRVEFADLLPTVSGEMETGHGVRLATVSKPFRQGALETTQKATDLAVEGLGFFVLRDPDGALFYTRAGEFHVDALGNLANPLDLVVQGSSGDLSLSSALTVAAQSTSQLGFTLNLDAAAATPAAAFPAGPDASSGAWASAANYSLIAPLYDSAGAAHELTFMFRKAAPGTWDYRVLGARNELDATAPASSDLRDLGAGGTLRFNADGSFDAVASNVSSIGALSWVGGGTTQSIAAGALTFDGTVQYAESSSIMSLRTDGAAAGSLRDIAIDRTGVISGRYSNGRSRAIGELVLANFSNVEGLAAIGDGLYRETLESGPASVGRPGENALGQIVSGALEMSTVDLATEFVSLINSQRDFQLSSRVITMADELYTEAANLKK